MHRKLAEHLTKLESYAVNHVSNLQLKVRSAVSKDKFRFQDGVFDLDLSYITNRIIAMGYPGTAFEKAWRNSIDDVAACLEKYHNNNYLVINVSERTYEQLPLQRVEYYGWPDHQPPSLTVLLTIVQRMDQWLNSDPANVVVIHCMAGRGRTGSVIAAYLLYIRMYQSAPDALAFFASRRSSTATGVQVPSQIRFVNYFQSMVQFSVTSTPAVPIPRKLKLKTIMMRPVPENFDLSGDFTPSVVIEWFTVRPARIIFSNQNANLKTFIPKDGAIVIDTRSLEVEGDIMIRVHSDAVFDSLSDKPIFRFAFHTSFVQNYIMDFPRDQLDSGGAGPLKDSRISDDFCVRLIFTE